MYATFFHVIAAQPKRIIRHINQFLSNVGQFFAVNLIFKKFTLTFHLVDQNRSTFFLRRLSSMSPFYNLRQFDADIDAGAQLWCQLSVLSIFKF